MEHSRFACSRYFVGGATLVEAIILAAEISPDNPHIQFIRKHGLKDVIEFEDDEHTKPWQLDWAIKQCNQYHEGSKWTLDEIYSDCLEAEAAWKRHAKFHSISASSCPATGPLRYDARYEAFILEHYPPSQGYWRKPEHYIDSKAFRHAMDRVDMYDKYVKVLDSSCDYLAHNFNVESIIVNNQSFAVEWGKCAAAHDANLMKEVLLEGLKLLMPYFADDEVKR